MPFTGSRSPPSTDLRTLPVLNFNSLFPPQPPSPGMSGPVAWPGAPVQASGRIQIPPTQPVSEQDTWKETKTGNPSTLRKAGHLLRRRVTQEEPKEAKSAPSQQTASNEKSALAQTSASQDLPIYDDTEELRQALRLSEEEERLRRQEDEAFKQALAASEKESGRESQRGPEGNLQEALEASKTESTQSKGKGKAPQRSDSTDSDELERAIELSLQDSNRKVYIDDLTDEELAQLAEWGAPRHPGMFEDVDTSSLSIISEQTEQPTIASPFGEPTPTASPYLADHPQQDEEPSYFGLWMGSDYQHPSGDVKGYINNQPAQFLPPLSQLVNLGQTQNTDFETGQDSSRISRRPLPEPPTLPPRNNGEQPVTPGSQADNPETATSQAPSGPAPPLPPRTPVPQDTDFRKAPDSLHSTITNEDSGYRTALSEADRSSTDLGSVESHGTVSQSLDEGPSTSSSRAPSEVIWPQHQPMARLANELPAGAHYGIDNESDANIYRPSVVRFGFLSSTHHDLEPINVLDPFPDVIQLTRSTDVDEYATFGLETATFSGLTRFLSLHGDTRIEASPRDITSEKVGTGTTALAASFLKGPNGPCVRLACHLLPPNTDIDARPLTAPAPSKSTSVLRRSRTTEAPQVISLPDSLTLPVTFSDIAAMLLTLRHLAFLAASMPESKQTDGSYSSLKSLGQKIAELSRAHSQIQSDEDKGKVRFKDRLKSKISSRKV